MQFWWTLTIPMKKIGCCWPSGWVSFTMWVWLSLLNYIIELLYTCTFVCGVHKIYIMLVIVCQANTFITSFS